MKFSCDRISLLESVTAASRAVAVKSSFPALEGILITAKCDKIRLTGFDLALGIDCLISANIDAEGSIVVDARVFGDIVRRLASDTITVSVDANNLVNIICGLSEFNIIGIDSAEFPELFKVDANTAIKIKQPVLRSMIKQTIFAVAQNDSKPAHTGLLFDVDHNVIKLVGVDGYRLSLRKEILDQSYDPISFIVPGKTLSEILKILTDNDIDVDILLSEKHIIFRIDNITLISRLIEGEFLNYTNVIPSECNISTIVDTSQFIDCIERASLLISEKLKGPIRCSFDYDIIKISTKTTLGNMYDEIPAVITGGNIEFGFNNRYMLDALKACEEENVRIEVTTPLSPIILKPESGDEFLILVLPVKLKEEFVL